MGAHYQERNLQSNLEVHAEAAFIPEDVRLTVEPSGALMPVADASVTIVAGVRYLTTTNTTIIVDVYL